MIFHSVWNIFKKNPCMGNTEWVLPLSAKILCKFLADFTPPTFGCFNHRWPVTYLIIATFFWNASHGCCATFRVTLL